MFIIDNKITVKYYVNMHLDNIEIYRIDRKRIVSRIDYYPTSSFIYNNIY